MKMKDYYSKVIFYRLASLTTFNNKNQMKTVDEVNPMYTKALRRASLVRGSCLVLSEFRLITDKIEEVIESNSDSPRTKPNK